ncbi:MAG: anaerobic ribonucleoside-triphosphate reductase activating protein [Bacilli bacterium]|nr:anaerobic ribonucleoside-triphosphate reductase activating protein [Bacilli bacterium]
MSKIAGIYWDDTAAAPGISLSVYFSGCHFHCPGCHNPEAWDFNYGQDFSFEIIKEIIDKLNKNGVKRSLSILGGEPLCDENLIAVQALIDWCKQTYPDLVIYVWTGYTLEELKARKLSIIDHILSQITCLIDGRFEIDKRDTTLPLRGSSNQRIIKLNDIK